ncbi:MAG: hypothetical protein JWM47_1362 [Acidimicrobiales bacterium]|nr:hypothetical protein [Acidimicrobiales bacterium]
MRKLVASAVLGVSLLTLTSHPASAANGPNWRKCFDHFSAKIQQGVDSGQVKPGNQQVLLIQLSNACPNS